MCFFSKTHIPGAEVERGNREACGRICQAPGRKEQLVQANKFTLSPFVPFKLQIPANELTGARPRSWMRAPVFSRFFPELQKSGPDVTPAPMHIRTLSASRTGRKTMQGFLGTNDSRASMALCSRRPRF